jgi:hypothetical protein
MAAEDLGVVTPGYCMIQKENAEEKSAGGIVIPDVAKVDKDQEARVVQCGWYVPQGRNANGEGALISTSQAVAMGVPIVNGCPCLPPGTRVWFNHRVWMNLKLAGRQIGTISTWEITRFQLQKPETT